MRYRRTAALAVLAAFLMPATVQAAPPIAGNDNATTDEDTPVSINVLANDSDPDGDELDILGLPRPSHGSVQFAEPFGTFVYTPQRNYYGSDQFSYTVVDGNGGSATATVSIFVRPVNDPPNAGDRLYSVVEDGSVTVLLQANDPDKEGCDLFFSIESGPVHGDLGPLTDAGCNPNGDMVDVVYTPDANFTGDEFFTYCVFDGVVQDCARAFISISPVNDAPVAQAGTASTNSGAPVSITLNGYDIETCELAFAIAGQPSNGTLSVPGAAACVPTGQGATNTDSAPITYTPATGFGGTDSFSFTVSDGSVVSAPATVTISVTAPPTVHVGDLDASTVKGSGSWQATVTIRIDNFGHGSVSGAVVRGTWASGLTSTCTTSAAGTCSVGSGSLARKVQSTTFRITAVTAGSNTYDSAANHDPDGSSNGTLITIARP